MEEKLPEMTREEYLQFLVAVRGLDAEKEYFLIKVFATLDLGLVELQDLTVEACQKGRIPLPDGETCVIPSCLREELLEYARRHGITAGPIFVTRTGKPLNRSNITNSIHHLAEEIGVDPEKCCPRALHRVYCTTRKDLAERLQVIYMDSYENLLNTEQLMVAWSE